MLQNGRKGNWYFDAGAKYPKKESPGGAFFALMKSVSVVLLHITHNGDMQLVQLLLPVPTK